MKYSETGFRPFYHHFCLITVTEKIKSALAEFQGGDIADGILTYGYFDPDNGMMLEVIAAAKIEDNNVRFAETNPDVRATIRAKDIAETECYYFGDQDERLGEKYSEKITMLRQYDVKTDVEKTRQMAFLDDYRIDENIDDILVYLTRQGLETELCRTRICGLVDRAIEGILLDEPQQDFTWHQGEKITICLQETESGKLICTADLNPPFPVTPEQLADGSLLRNAVNVYAADDSEENFIRVLALLRDSLLWMPFEKSGKKKSKHVPETDKMKPAIVSNDKVFYVPVFTDFEAMSNYGSYYTKQQRSISDAIALAKDHKKEEIVGIAIDPFSEHPFILDKKMWPIVENMRSNLMKD